MNLVKIIAVVDLLQMKKDGIGIYVIVEANNENQANSLAELIGIYFDGVDEGIDCSRCGDRWYPVDDGDDYAGEHCLPLEYYASQAKDWGSKAYIHYLNGEIKEIK